MNYNSKMKAELVEEYKKFNQIIEEKKQKLFLEDIDLKNHLVSMKVGAPIELQPTTTHFPFKSSNSVRRSSADKQNQGENARYNMEENEENLENIQALEMNETEEINEMKFEELAKNEKNKDEENDLNLKESNSNNTNNNIGNNNSYKSIHSVKKDPMILLAIEKIKPLFEGIILYKRFNSGLKNSKSFDSFSSANSNPENCGYALRVIKLNPSEETIEIKNWKTKLTELKINLLDIKGILIDNTTKQFIKSKENLIKKPNSNEIDKLVQSDYIPFIFLYTDGSVDFIAQSYSVFSIFKVALDELLIHKKNILSYFKFQGE